VSVPVPGLYPERGARCQSGPWARRRRSGDPAFPTATGFATILPGPAWPCAPP